MLHASTRIIQACQSFHSTAEQLRLPHSARCLTTSGDCVSCHCSINLLRRQSPGYTRRENTGLCEATHLATAFFCFALAINLLCHSLPHERFAQATHVTRGTAADCLEVAQILQTLDCFQWTNIANPSFRFLFQSCLFFLPSEFPEYAFLCFFFQSFLLGMPSLFGFLPACFCLTFNCRLILRNASAPGNLQVSTEWPCRPHNPQAIAANRGHALH